MLSALKAAEWPSGRSLWQGISASHWPSPSPAVRCNVRGISTWLAGLKVLALPLRLDSLILSSHSERLQRDTERTTMITYHIVYTMFIY